MIICLIFCTNQVAVYGAELVSFSDGVEEQGEISSAGIEEMDSSETEEEGSVAEGEETAPASDITPDIVPSDDMIQETDETDKN